MPEDASHDGSSEAKLQTEPTAKRKGPRVDKLSEMEQLVLKRIRRLDLRYMQVNNPLDVKTVRDKVVARMCDEDRNFARNYMMHIIKDMKHL